jgi:hypothetical protein
MSSNKEEKILKLYNYSKDENKTKEIGSKILKSMIIDAIRSKLGYIDKGITLPWNRDPFWIDIGQPWKDVISPWIDRWSDVLFFKNEVSRTLSEITAEVELTDEELRIARELGVLKKTYNEEG